MGKETITEPKESDSRKTTRRAFLGSAIVIGGGFYFYMRNIHNDEAIAAEAATSTPQEVTIVEFSDSGERKQSVKVPKVVKSEAEWRKQLTPNAFDITRHDDTEMAFTGKYWNEHDKGLYRCICCGTALFDSATKFESGTGWPSFYQPIAEENVATSSDRSFGMQRNAVSCKRCDAHLGHVFDDGPKPTGQRYCMNSASLNFIKHA
jgi:peptide-methionine (R)-S-oxide reductase